MLLCWLVVSLWTVAQVHSKRRYERTMHAKKRFIFLLQKFALVVQECEYIRVSWLPSCLFSRQEHGITKIETVGKTFMAAGILVSNVQWSPRYPSGSWIPSGSQRISADAWSGKYDIYIYIYISDGASRCKQPESLRLGDPAKSNEKNYLASQKSGGRAVKCNSALVVSCCIKDHQGISARNLLRRRHTSSLLGGNNQIDAASIKILRLMVNGLFLILLVGQLMMVSFDVLHALYIQGHL